jgi:hypothetical protein
MTIVIGYECSSLKTDMRHQCDYSSDCSERRLVETTAAWNDHCFELAGDATSASLADGELQSVGATEAPKSLY